MIRRWSCLDTLNFQLIAPFLLRFEYYKAIKAINYKNFSIGLTKFKRPKLAKKRRNTSWLFYTSLFRLWPKDYNLTKKIIRSQFLDSIFLNSTLIYSFSYLKKKNILISGSNSFFLSYSIPNFFFKYFYKKFSSRNALSLLSTFSKTNFLIAVQESNESVIDDKTIPIVRKIETDFYSLQYSTNLDKIVRQFYHDLVFLKILQLYKNFSLFFFFIIR